jgi:NAD(P)-dependent dehydrogenase (short-subunit alcohol dehydrogenase family)
MAGRVEGKIALVTGGASGIGKACAQALAREGAIVLIGDIQDEKGAAVADEIGAQSGRCEFRHHDVTQEDEWVGIIGEIRARHGRLDVLVNNAGIALAGPVTTMSLADWRRQTAVNLDGVFLGLKHGLALMRESGDGGSIINMSSVAGLNGAPLAAGYCASKGGVRLMTKAVAMECAKEKIRVNSVHPGLINTPIWDTIASPGSPPMNLDAMAMMVVPNGVKGEPPDVAGGVLWLASDESRYVTGSELVIDGGWSAR